MNTGLKVVELPPTAMQDIPAALRRLADRVEAGEFGAAHNIGYVVDCGDHEIAVGLLGQAPEAGVSAYYLFGLAMRKLEGLS